MRTLLGVLIALAAACGDDENRNPLADAPIAPDARPDAPTTGPVTLTITLDGAGVEGVLVHFQNADSSLVRSATTDADGVASAEMDPGGFVTAIDPFPPQPIPKGGPAPQDRDLRTFAGVKPGDQLRLAEGGFLAPIVSVNLTFVPDPNATFYMLSASCMSSQVDVTDPDGSGGSGGPGGLVALLGCAEGTVADLVVIAHDIDFIPIRTLQLANATLTADATIDLGETYTDVQDVTYSWTNVPASIGAVNVQGVLASPRGILVDTFSSATVGKGSATTAPLRRPVLQGVTQITASTFFGPQFSRHNMLEWGAPVQDYSVELGDALLGDYDGAPEFDVANHRVNFTTAAGGAAADFALTFSAFLRKDGNGVQFWSWSLAAPIDAGTLTYPVLPPDSADLNPLADDLNDVEELVTVKVPGGYDAVRANVLSLDSPLGLVTGASGRVVFQELQRGKGKRVKKSPAQLLKPWAGRARSTLKKALERR